MRSRRRRLTVLHATMSRTVMVMKIQVMVTSATPRIRIRKLTDA